MGFIMAQNLVTSIQIRAGVDGINDINRLADAIEQAGGDVSALRQQSAQLQSTWNTLSTTEQTQQLQALTAQAEQLRRTTNARLTLGLTGDQQIRQQIQSINTAYQTLVQSGTLTQQELNRATQAHQAQLARLQAQLQGTSNAQDNLTAGADRLKGAWGGLSGLMGALGLSLGVAEIVKMSDEFNNLEARVKLAAGEGINFNNAMSNLRDIADETQLPLTATGDLFGKLTGATKDLGLSQQEVLDITRTINQAMSVSGGSAESMDAAITQLAQGLSAGALRGDEFNSVVEQSPRLAQAMADGLGVTIGKLREMAGEGKLTAEVVTNALKDQADVIAGEFAKMPNTVSGSLTVLKNTVLGFIGDMDNQLNSSAGLAGFIGNISTAIKNIDPATIDATKDALGQLGEIAKVLYENIELTAEHTQAMLDVFGGVGEADEKVSFLTRTVQGLAIMTGTVADGVKVIGIAFQLLAGVVTGAIGKIAQAFSGVTGLGKAWADEMIAQSQKMFAAAQTAAMEFESSAKQALDNAAKTNQQRLQETADKAKSAYDAMASSGTASSEQLQGAFADYAQKAIKANNGVIDATLQNELAQHQLQAVISKTGEVTLQTYDQLTQKTQQVDLSKFKDEFSTLKIDMDEFATGVDSKISKSLGAFNELAKLSGDNVGQLALAYQGAKDAMGGNTQALNALNQALDEAVGGNAQLAQKVKDTAQAQKDAKTATDDQKKALDALGVSIDAANAKMSTSGHKMAQNLKVGLSAIKEQVKGADELKGAIATALDTSIASAKTVADFKAIQEAIKEAGVSGQVSGEQLAKINAGATGGAEGVKALNDRLKEQSQVLANNDKALAKNAQATKALAKAQSDSAKASSDMAQGSEQAASAANSGAGGFAAAVAKIVNGIRSQMSVLTNMGATIEQLNKVFDGFGKLAGSRNRGIMQIGGYFAELDRLTKSAVKSMTDMDSSVARANQSLSAQEFTVTDLAKAQATLSEATNFNILGIIKLDKAKLQGLQAQIKKAKEQMQEFSDTAKNTMQDLDSELATLQGREADAMRIKQAQKLADLQAKMAEAVARGNGEEIAHYSKALELQKQINSEQNRQAEDKATSADLTPKADNTTSQNGYISANDVVNGFAARIEQAKEQAKIEGRQEFAKELLDAQKRTAR